MTPRVVAVSDEHLQRAYAQVRRPGWPSLEELRAHYLDYSVVRARAVALANGQVLPPEPVATAPPALNVPKPAPWPAPPTRRRTDDPAPFSTRAAQAGEYLHPDE